MILVNKEEVFVRGDEPVMLAELTSAIRAVREILIEECGQESADKLIASAGRLTVMTPEGLHQEMKRTVLEFIGDSNLSEELKDALIQALSEREDGDD